MPKLLSTEEQLTEPREYLPMSNGHDTARELTLADFLPASEWTIEDAVETYNIDRWGLGYFGINPQGHVTISPSREAGATIDIMDVLKDAEEWNLRFPLVIRFQDLLRDRVVTLNKGFQ
ncbi:MAG: hypothetical protein ACHQNE_07705, partial [Candidatus Kapaibacterium sp.]